MAVEDRLSVSNTAIFGSMDAKLSTIISELVTLNVTSKVLADYFTTGILGVPGGKLNPWYVIVEDPIP
jgi:hypothetical protein